MKTLHRRTTTARAKARGSRGFTIIELVVSIGILAILMVVAGSVFALTLKSSGQATAVIDIHQWLRALEDSLREDLRYVQPGASIMVIQSHAINGYLTADAKEIDIDANPLNQSEPRDPQRERVVNKKIQVEPSRADMLMFFTSRPGTSFRDPQVSGTLQQVVYGHALPGEWDAVTKKWTPTIPPPSGFVDAFAESSFTPDQLQHMGMDYQYQLTSSTSNPPVFATPARDWHLFRRSVLIVDQDLSSPPDFPVARLNDDSAVVTGNDDDPQYSGVPKAFYIRDGRRDYLVNGVDPTDPSPIPPGCPDNNGCPFDYAYHVIGRLKQHPDGPLFGPELDVDSANNEALVNWMPRSRLDYAPPSNQTDRMGQYFLPHCASFKVEWALDIRDVIAQFDSDASFVKECADVRDLFAPLTQEVIWVDPLEFGETVEKLGTILNQMSTTTANISCSQFEMPEFTRMLMGKLIMPGNDYQTRPNPDRFVDTSGTNVRPYDTHIFYASKPFSVHTQQQNVVDQPDPLFPKALRITVDVYDPAGRLDRPIRHVMVIPVGE